MQLSGLFIYPVKSLRGIAVSSAEIDTLGLVGDRRFLIVDEDGRFLTQRVLPQMALIETELTSSDLLLGGRGSDGCAVPMKGLTSRVNKSVSIWKSSGLIADDCGNDPAKWLTSFLGRSCRLVRVGKKFRRPVLDPQNARPGDVLAFADSYPFLIISEASLEELNDRLIFRGEDAVPMNRFRPNLVVSGCAAFAEDSWPRLKIGSIAFRAAGACERCIVTTTDQLTGERGKEPLRTLAGFRRKAADSTAVNFGQNLVHESKSGALRLGDVVAIM